MSLETTNFSLLVPDSFKRQYSDILHKFKPFFKGQCKRFFESFIQVKNWHRTLLHLGDCDQIRSFLYTENFEWQYHTFLYFAQRQVFTYTIRQPHSYSPLGNLKEMESESKVQYFLILHMDKYCVNKIAWFMEHLVSREMFVQVKWID